jgi:4-hydroxy-4-methyl-2-oxoglutarate aldolase
MASPRPSESLLKEFEPLPAAALGYVKGLTRVMDPGVKPVAEGMKVMGPAFTVDDKNNCLDHLEKARKGDVIVIAADGHRQSVWGPLFSESAMYRELAGVVTDGAVIGVAGLRGLGFPVFARYAVPVTSSHTVTAPVNVSVTCGGARVDPGDIVVGDDDGVVVIPLQRVEEVLEAVRVLGEAGRLIREEMQEERKPIYEVKDYRSLWEGKATLTPDWSAYGPWLEKRRR